MEGRHQTRTPVIDMHCHCAGIGVGSECFVSESLRGSWKYRFYLKGFGLTPAELEAEGDQVSIRSISKLVEGAERVNGAVILAMDAVVDSRGDPDWSRTMIYVPNEFVKSETAKYSNLYFGTSVNPYRRDALERLEKCKESGGILVKWLPSIQDIDPADTRLTPFYDRLIQLDLPLLSHAGKERSFTAADDSLSDPNRLRLPLEMGVRVVAAHLGSTGRTEGEDNMERTVTLMKEFPNLWADVSALTQLNRRSFFLRALESPQIHRRLLYGTDFPLVNMPLVSPFFFPRQLSVRRMRSIARIENPWDRDVELKASLGLPRMVFENSAQFLKIL